MQRGNLEKERGLYGFCRAKKRLNRSRCYLGYILEWIQESHLANHYIKRGKVSVRNVRGGRGQLSSE